MQWIVNWILTQYLFVYVVFPLTKRQMICKDLGISELLFELLYFMKMNLREDIFSDQHNQR